MSKKREISGGMSIVTPLTLIFVICKLLGVIKWSWWWVFSPLWISVSLAFTIFAIALIFVAAFDKT